MVNGFWRQAAHIFDERAQEYDQWFDNSLLFAIELATLRGLSTVLVSPRLEIGVGPGRFAQALGVEYGIDPALAPLQLAQGRGVRGCRAVGEALPFSDGVMGTVLLLFTLCFVESPQATLAESKRVLGVGGHLVVGHIVGRSPWGKMLATKKKEGHPFYRHARFYDPGQVEGWLANAGFTVVEQRSGLLQPPDALREVEASVNGFVEGAGFVVMVARRARAI